MFLFRACAPAIREEVYFNLCFFLSLCLFFATVWKKTLVLSLSLLSLATLSLSLLLSSPTAARGSGLRPFSLAEEHLVRDLALPVEVFFGFWLFSSGCEFLSFSRPRVKIFL